MTLQLHSYFRSSTSYRVRIALNLKGVVYGYHGVDIRKDAHRDTAFVDAHDTTSVPVLVTEDGTSIGQSLAIIDWLDATYPEPRLIPAKPLLRARVLEVAHLIAMDIHPVNNLRVLKYLGAELGADQATRDRWYAHWIAQGLAGVERLLVRHGSPPYAFGDAPTLADCCLVPQVFNASRSGCDTSAFPRTMAAYAHATAQPAFIAAAPENQPDAD